MNIQGYEHGVYINITRLANDFCFKTLNGKAANNRPTAELEQQQCVDLYNSSLAKAVKIYRDDTSL